MEKFAVSLYICGCGYKTTNPGNSSKHKKVSCGHGISVSSVSMVLEKDHLSFVDKLTNKGDGTTVSIDGERNVAGDNNTVDMSDNSVNINFVLPERTTKEDFMEYLLAMDHLGFRTPEQVATMPGKMLMFTRGAKKLPGAIIERNKKIIEKLPDGTERIMGKKKAIQTYTHEAVDALCWRPPAHGVSDFLETERGDKRTKVSIQDAAKLRVTNPRGYHHGVPDDVKFRHQKIESHTEKALDKITTDNKLDGFL
jgi:hypothetical protein